MKKSLTLFIIFTCWTILCFAHSGGLDANGGHYNRKTGEYHCHRCPCGCSDSETKTTNTKKSSKKTSTPQPKNKTKQENISPKPDSKPEIQQPYKEEITDKTIDTKETKGDKQITADDIPKESIKKWLDEFWMSASDDEKIWLKVQFYKAFPDYLLWLQKKQTTEEIKNDSFSPVESLY